MDQRRPRGTRTRRWPGWLGTLALVLHLLAPGLCLAQQLSSSPLGALCTADPGRMAAPPEAAAGAHLLDHCDHCLPFAALPPEHGDRQAEAPPAADVPAPAAHAPPHSRSEAWRPPPRAPPASA
ncbi:MAG: hypothetical protein KIS72_12790 [Luteimonas sp.]|nr:hypothetical protein [Luteimonas sp.]